MKTTENEFKINNNYRLIEILESKRDQPMKVFDNYSSKCGSFRYLLGDYLYDDFLDQYKGFDRGLFHIFCRDFSTRDEFGFGRGGTRFIWGNADHSEWLSIFGEANHGSIDDRIAVIKGHIARLESEIN